MRDQRQSTRVRRDTITMASLATELDLDVHHLNLRCERFHISVSGPDSTISAWDADRLRQDHWDDIQGRIRTRRILLGMGRESQGNHGVRLPIPRSQRPAQAHKATTAELAVTFFPDRMMLDYDDIEVKWTTDGRFTPREARAWWGAGLGPYDAERAALLRDLDLRPEHLSISVRGDTMRDRLEQGMSPERIVRILREQDRM